MTPFSWICPVCLNSTPSTHADLKLIYPDEMSVFKCTCGLAYTNYARDGELPDIYDASYYDHPRYTTTRGREEYIKHLAEYVVHNTQFPSNTEIHLLDVCCATGDFVKWAISNGLNAEGIDISQQAVEIGTANGLPLHCGDIFQTGIAKNMHTDKFNIITMWDVLEHLSDPLQALKALKQYLAPGGLLFLKTVSQNSIIETIGRFLYRATGGRNQSILKRLYVPGHLYYYTKDLLKQQVQQAGLAL